MTITIDGSGIGVLFSSNISGLFRPQHIMLEHMTNLNGTVYGDEFKILTFPLQACNGI